MWCVYIAANWYYLFSCVCVSLGLKCFDQICLLTGVVYQNKASDNNFHLSCFHHIRCFTLPLSQQLSHLDHIAQIDNVYFKYNTVKMKANQQEEVLPLRGLIYFHLTF